MGITTKAQVMKAAIYSPYLDTLGGGEKYVATLSKELNRLGYQTSFWWPDKTIISKLNKRFGLNLSGVQIDPIGYNTIISQSVLAKYQLQSQIDCLCMVSDGSIPLMFGKKNILHFQVPFKNKSHNLINILKFKFINHIICNSQYTKSIVDQTYGINSQVVYPPATMITPQTKENLILNVGRLDGLLHNKRQDILIKAFRQLNPKGWKLALLGGLQHQEGREQLKKLTNLIGNSNITILANPSFSQVKSYYSKAKIYWHAAGFGINAIKHPEKVEHFGISTVEAMSAGAVPVVYGAGGQLEIIKPKINGYTFNSVDELINTTNKLIKNHQLFPRLSYEAIKTSKNYSTEAFVKALKPYIS